jgi:hypothetical protein
MRPERKFSHESSYTLKYARISWNWNHIFFEDLGAM